MRDEQDYENLAELIEIVIDVNNKLYKRVMKTRYDQFRDKTELIYKLVAGYVKTKQQLYIKNSKYTDLTSMKFNITQQYKKRILRVREKAKKSYVTNVKRQIISQRIIAIKM